MALRKVNQLWKMRFGIKKRIAFYEKLKSYTEQEFPVYDTLNKFKKRYDKKKDVRGKIIGVWLDNMKNGYSFSNSVRGWIPESELNLIASGEEGRGIENGLAHAVNFATKAKQIKSTIIKGAAYPLFLIVFVAVFVAMFSLKMAPVYVDLLPMTKWPPIAKNFYYVSDFLVNYWLIVVGGIIGLSFFISKTIGVWTGKVREKIFDKIPPWSVYKIYQACVFLISLSSMMQSGVPLNDALTKMKKTSARWVEKYINFMQRNLKKGGQNFGQHLNVGLLDEETAMDVIDYSELGNFENAIHEIGERNLQESIQKIEAAMGVARILALILIAVVVGLIYYINFDLNNIVAESVSMRR